MRHNDAVTDAMPTAQTVLASPSNRCTLRTSRGAQNRPGVQRTRKYIHGPRRHTRRAPSPSLGRSQDSVRAPDPALCPSRTRRRSAGVRRHRLGVEASRRSGTRGGARTTTARRDISGVWCTYRVRRHRLPAFSARPRPGCEYARAEGVRGGPVPPVVPCTDWDGHVEASRAAGRPREGTGTPNGPGRTTRCRRRCGCSTGERLRRSGRAQTLAQAGSRAERCG